MEILGCLCESQRRQNCPWEPLCLQPRGGIRVPVGSWPDAGAAQRQVSQGHESEAAGGRPHPLAARLGTQSAGDGNGNSTVRTGEARDRRRATIGPACPSGSWCPASPIVWAGPVLRALNSTVTLSNKPGDWDSHSGPPPSPVTYALSPEGGPRAQTWHQRLARQPSRASRKSKVNRYSGSTGH